MARDKTTFKPTSQQVQSAPANLRDSVPPASYRGLHSGPQLDIEYEENRAKPVDGSDSGGAAAHHRVGAGLDGSQRQRIGHHRALR